MKLNEIRDPNEYRSGDAINPRSPDYIDPMDGVNVESYGPEPIVWKVQSSVGKHQNDQYSFVIIGQCSGDNADAQYIKEYVSDKFADAFPNYELVWDEDTVTNNVRTFIDYIQGATPESNDPAIAEQIQVALNKLTQEIVYQIAEERAEEDVRNNPPPRPRWWSPKGATAPFTLSHVESRNSQQWLRGVMGAGGHLD